MKIDNQEDKRHTDFDALMVYLNEAKDQKTTDEILSSPEGCKQIESLQKDMNTIENSLNDYEIDDNYGFELWNKISDKLEDQPKQSLIQKIILSFQHANFSAIGLSAVFVIAITFYMLGSKQAIEESQSLRASNQNLLAQNMQLHLTQTSMFLTQVSNMSNQQNSPVLIQTAENLLATNRIYRSAYTNKNNKRLENLLTELEQVLMEVSNGENINSHRYIKDFANNELLYKVKSNNQKLKSQLAKQKQTTRI